MCEESLECVPSPLQRVLNGVGEVLEGADGNLLLRRVLGGAIALCQVRNYNLGKGITTVHLQFYQDSYMYVYGQYTPNVV